VVGGGGGGLVAAIMAAEKGNSVVLVEKMEATGGASQHATLFQAQGARAQLEAGIPFEEEAVLQEYIAISNYSVDPWLLRTIMRKSAETANWMEDQGVEWKIMWGYLCPAGVDQTGTTALGMKEVTDRLFAVAQEQGVEFLLKTGVSALVRDDDRIVGVQAETMEGESLYVKGRKAVILAAGGFSNNREMLKKYCPTAYDGAAAAFGMPCDTGEAVRMGIGAGADMTGLDSFSGFCGGIPYAEMGLGPYHTYLYRGDVQLARQPWLFLNKACERFMSEDQSGIQWHSRQVELASQPGHRGYAIFDSKYERIMDGNLFNSVDCKMPLRPDLPGVERIPETLAPHDWQVAAQEAIEKGAIKQADTLEDLARELELDPVKFAKAVELYNGYCAQGQDPDFGKPAELLIPVQDPPFYGIPVSGLIEATKCGLRVNTQMQVLDKDCNIIPGLYAVFHTAGGANGENSMFWLSVVASVGLSYTGGYIAGENAAAETV